MTRSNLDELEGVLNHAHAELYTVDWALSLEYTYLGPVLRNPPSPVRSPARVRAGREDNLFGPALCENLTRGRMENDGTVETLYTLDPALTSAVPVDAVVTKRWCRGQSNPATRLGTGHLVALPAHPPVTRSARFPSGGSLGIITACPCSLTLSDDPLGNITACPWPPSPLCSSVSYLRMTHPVFDAPACATHPLCCTHPRVGPPSPSPLHTLTGLKGLRFPSSHSSWLLCMRPPSSAKCDGPSVTRTSTPAPSRWPSFQHSGRPSTLTSSPLPMLCGYCELLL